MRVSNAARNDVLPTSADMNFYGGLYREAELIVTERTAVSPLYLGTEGVLVHQRSATKAKAEGEIEVHLTSLSDGSCPLTLTIAAPDGRTVLTKNLHVKVDGKPVRIAYNIASPELWRPGRPALYTVTIKVGEGPHSDRVSVRTGFREIKALPSALLLNGDSMKLHGVTLYHDNAVSAGTLTAADYRTDLHEIRTLGANALRSAVMPHAHALYDLCDEQGMLVWIDTPLRQAPFLSDAGYFATPAFEQNGLEQLREIVAQNLNHPSVVMWGIFSRMRTTGDDVTPYIRQLHRAARELDPSRPTVAVSERNGGINFITDLIVWRKEEGWNKGRPDNLTVWLDGLRKEWSHLRSAIEYGGEGFLDHRNYTAQPPAGARLAAVGHLAGEHVRLRLGPQALRDQRMRSGDARPPQPQGCLLSLQGAVEQTRTHAAHSRQTRDAAHRLETEFPRLLVVRRTRADDRPRHGGHEALRPLPVSLGHGESVGPRDGESEGRCAERQRHPADKLRLKTERLSGPSANNRSMNERPGAKGCRSANTCT